MAAQDHPSDKPIHPSVNVPSAYNLVFTLRCGEASLKEWPASDVKQLTYLAMPRSVGCGIPWYVHDSACRLPALPLLWLSVVLGHHLLWHVKQLTTDYLQPKDKIHSLEKAAQLPPLTEPACILANTSLGTMHAWSQTPLEGTVCRHFECLPLTTLNYIVLSSL